MQECLHVLESHKEIFLEITDMANWEDPMDILEATEEHGKTKCKDKCKSNLAVSVLQKFDSLKHELAHTLYLYGESLSEYRDQEDYDTADNLFESLNDDNEIVRILPPHKANTTEFRNLERGLRHNESALRRFQNYETDKVIEYLNHPRLYNNRDLEDTLDDIFRQIDDFRRFLLDFCDNIYSAWGQYE